MEATKVTNPTETPTPVQKALEKILRDIDNNYSKKDTLRSLIHLDLLTLEIDLKKRTEEKEIAEAEKSLGIGVPNPEDFDQEDYDPEEGLYDCDGRRNPEEERYDVKDSDLELLGNSYSENDR